MNVKYFKSIKDKTVEMTQSVMVFCLFVCLFKYEDMSMDSQPSCKKLGVALCTCNPRNRKAEAGGSMRLVIDSHSNKTVPRDHIYILVYPRIYLYTKM